MEAKSHIDSALAGLKDFQLATVNHTIAEFYHSGKNKMLIADEVGLGKTIVARGIVAKMYEKFLEKNGKAKTFNVIYICSNQAIASQNIGKLNIINGEAGKDIVDYSRDDDRITALAYQPKETTSTFNIRIKAFTPATSFDQNTNAGRSDERGLLFRLLYNHSYLKEKRNSLKWLIKGTKRMNEDNWENAIEDAIRFDSGKQLKHYYWRYRKIRKGIKTRFYKALQEKAPINELKKVYEALGIEKEKSCIFLLSKICSNRIQKNNYYNDKYRVFWDIISYLRFKLSDCCKEYLEADLFILDEFQRYNKLIKIEKTDNPGIELARQILSKENAKVLMLSATPFKPYTNDFDELHGEHHYSEFKNVLKFLLNGESDSFWRKLENNRSNFFKHIRHASEIKDNFDEARISKENLEKVYRSCIARTERMLVSKDKDAMIKSNIKVLDLRAEDIKDFVLFDKIVEHLNAEHSCRLAVPTEYVKSCPYPLSFLINYQHKKAIEKYYKEDGALQNLINKSRGAWVNLNLIKQYKALIPKKSKTIPNAKIRLLFDETIENDGWKYLWVPPSIPYYELRGAFQKAQGYSKTLIFSSWKMVPRMIASMSSYEAERLSIGKLIQKTAGRSPNYFNKKRFPFPLLTFRVIKGDQSLSGMNNFMINYPSIYLSSLYDSQRNIQEGRTLKEIKENLKELIKNRLIELDIFSLGTENGDWQKWSWYSILLLDAHHEDIDHLRSWLSQNISDDVAVDVEDVDNKADKTGKGQHLQEVRNVIIGGSTPNVSKLTQGQFDNLLNFLVDLCMGSPANASMRALDKIFDDELTTTLRNSYLIASGFISLFNKPESISVIQLHTLEKDYYRKVLEYSIAGNIQSMLDEYYYLLKDSNSIKSSDELAERLTEILSIRPSPLEIGSITSLKKSEKDKNNSTDRNRIRTHFALDFGQQKLSSATANRVISIREAFNSPFRPFVLASTSIGQEGLDFHFYCKKIIHWNLPSNPIDFEQREGRIHRYKGHVVRLNVAEKFKNKLAEINEKKHIWNDLFQLALDVERDNSHFPCDLIPYWHLETKNDLSIERIVPLYPFSKDIDKFQNMLKVLAYYRFTFGQPRQDELIQILEENFDFNEIDLIKDLMINLSPIYYNKSYEN
jgi:Helicase conserved C-terminal domain